MQEIENYNSTFLSKADLILKISHILEPDDFNKVISAYEMAEDVHLFQSRKDNTPYFFHVTRIVKIIINELYLYDADLFCAALLHDALEDSDVLNLETVTFNFGPYVSYMVDVLTRYTRIKEKKDFENNIQEYVEKLKHSTVDCIIIKLAERLDNFRCLSYGLKSNPIQYIEETFNYFIPLAQNFKHAAVEKLIYLLQIEKSKYFN